MGGGRKREGKIERERERGRERQREREEGEGEREGKGRGGGSEMTILWDLFSNNCRMPKISILQEFLSEAGFGLGSVMVLPDLLFKPEH